MRQVVVASGKIEVRDAPVPEPKYEEALIKLRTAGVCHSDVHIAKGDWPWLASLPLIRLGHEGIGVVEELGPGAEKFVQKGDRVILGLGGMGGGYWCGACEFCLSGRPRLCSQSRAAAGTYAEYVCIWAKALVKLPHTIKDEDVPLACAGLTAYSAVKKLPRYGVTPGKPIAIVGAAGGLGHYAIQIARLFGYKVIGIDIGKEKLDFITGIGADHAVDAADAVKFVREKFRGVSASIVLSPKVPGFELGLRLLGSGGLFIGVGMPAASDGSLSVSPLDLLFRDITMITSAVGTVEDMRELVQLAAEGKVKTHISKVATLEQAPQILEELEQGKYTGRAILRISH